jgi:hypothetical protein
MSAPDFNPEDQTQSPDNDFIRPAVEFNGTTLWPYTVGSRLLMARVFEDGDPLLYQALVFVFVHLKRTEKTAEADIAKHVTPKLWADLNEFRTFITITFRATLTEEEAAAALHIFLEEIEREFRSRVSIGPKPGSRKGPLISKKKATTRVKPRGKPSRSRKS